MYSFAQDSSESVSELLSKLKKEKREKMRCPRKVSAKEKGKHKAE